MFVVGGDGGGASESIAETLDTDKDQQMDQQVWERTSLACGDSAEIPMSQPSNSECQMSDLDVLPCESTCRLDLTNKTIREDSAKEAMTNLQLSEAKPQTERLPHSEYQKSDLKTLIGDSLRRLGNLNSTTIRNDSVEADKMQPQMVEAKTQPENKARKLITSKILSEEARQFFAATCGKGSGSNLSQICSTIEDRGEIKCVPASSIQVGSKPYNPSDESKQYNRVTRRLSVRGEKPDPLLLCCVAYGLVLSYL